ncbi:MAG: DinB family protein [Vicinamibacterales bacterium]
MTRTLTVTLAVVLASALPAAAQSKALAEAMQRLHAGVARNVVEAAEAMPESEYGFKPSEDVRSFGALVAHIANSNYSYCSRAGGVANPNSTDFETKTAKADLVAAVKAAVAFCDGVYTQQTDASFAELIAMGRNQAPRGMVLVQNISHNNEHYGNIVTYMRIKGHVPPSSARSGGLD